MVVSMYYSNGDKRQFIEIERAGLQASTNFARVAWSRAEANGQRMALLSDEGAKARTRAKRERFRAAHREAMAFESDVEGDNDEYGDLDEYGYAA